MTVQAVFSPIPYWPVLDKKAKLAIGGKMVAKRSIAPNEDKLVWQDPGRQFAYPTSGIPVRDNGTLPRMFFDNDEAYLLLFYDINGVLIDTWDNFFPPTNSGTGPINVNIDTDNHVLNGQFDFPRTIPTPLTVGPIEICEDVFFKKSNTAATDTISVIPFVLGTAPEGTPKNYVEYNCSAVGAGGETYKDFYWPIDRVTGFANTQISIGIQLASTTNSTVEIFAWQYFGTGGTPSADNIQDLGTFALDSTLSKYTLTEVLDTIAGKTLGTNNDDQLYIILRLPLNALSNIQFTNFQFNPGDTLTPFHHFSDFFTKAIIMGSRIPFPADDGSDRGKSLTVGANNDLIWAIPGNVGQFIWLGYDATEDTGDWVGWLKIDSSTPRNVSRTTYASLFAKFGTTWGNGDGSTTFGLPPLGDAYMMASNAVGTTGRSARTVGQTIGAETVTLVDANLPAGQYVMAGGGSVLDAGNDFPVSVKNGASTPISILPPTCVVCVMVKY